jgi:D-arabinose 1-dehydrogenase-like Zn-dependent alcohol dehydrogenase
MIEVVNVTQEVAVKAAVVHSFHEPLRIEEVPVPEPGPGEIVVRIETSGVCNTDIHVAHGDWPVKPVLPFVPGHEGVGIVDRIGAGVREVREGDRVAIPWLGWACGSCDEQQFAQARVDQALQHIAPERYPQRGAEIEL